uniref:TIL domain-containing protein n=1 Tax=Rhabditophanes sp. KR3021 TaxID=114890 RepID=A0AC35TFI8_9BILA
MIVKGRLGGDKEMDCRGGGSLLGLAGMKVILIFALVVLAVIFWDSVNCLHKPRKKGRKSVKRVVKKIVPKKKPPPITKAVAVISDVACEHAYEIPWKKGYWCGAFCNKLDGAPLKCNDKNKPPTCLCRPNYAKSNAGICVPQSMCKDDVDLDEATADDLKHDGVFEEEAPVLEDAGDNTNSTATEEIEVEEEVDMEEEEPI